ncbi:MAG: KamA family radical SAM protein [Candidatus Magnetoovum sp. WYHC-5]|nr:KamA family radical SAM protein [Candidatus Magnetoovum sp. WYHC-5]
MIERIILEEEKDKPPDCLTDCLVVDGQGSFFAVSDRWYDAGWQFTNSIQSLSELSKLLNIDNATQFEYEKLIRQFRYKVTPYYLSLIDWLDAADPIRKQCIPDLKEMDYHVVGQTDPLWEEEDMQVPGLVHRYPDRVLAIVTNICAMYCRHCTRKRKWYEEQAHTTKKEMALMVKYVKETPQVREVIVSGGDPLTMSLENLDWFLGELRLIPHVEVLRIGSRIPVVLPMAITEELVHMLAKHRPLWLNTQFNHPREITPQSADACDKLIRAGIPVSNQSVLLRGVNDSVDVMKELCYKLQKIMVRPYYLFQCDPVVGVEHLRTNVWKGIEIIENMRGHMGGLCIPTFVVDAPGGGGKIPLQPFYLLSMSDNEVILRNHEGLIINYHNPRTNDSGKQKISTGTLQSFFYKSTQPSESNILRLKRRASKSYYNEEMPKLLKIGLTYDLKSDYLKKGYTEEEAAEFDNEDTINAMEKTITSLGYKVQRIGNIDSLLMQLNKNNTWDMVFNICEGIRGRNREAQVPAVLEAYNISYTFSDPLTLSLCLDKAAAKKYLKAFDIPMARSFLVRSIESLSNSDRDLQEMGLPVFVKPVYEGSSKGIDGNSIVYDTDMLKGQCAVLFKKYKQPLLIEEFLPGREYTVGIVGNGKESECIGVLEIILCDKAEKNVYSYMNKKYCEELIDYVLVEDKAIVEEATCLALKVYNSLECKDAARVDLRADENGKLHFLEVNPLPGLNPVTSDLPILCSKIGISYRELIKKILGSALQRISLQSIYMKDIIHESCNSI